MSNMQKSSWSRGPIKVDVTCATWSLLNTVWYSGSGRLLPVKCINTWTVGRDSNATEGYLWRLKHAFSSMSPTFKNLRSDYMKNLVWNLRKLSKIDPVMDLRFWKLKKIITTPCPIMYKKQCKGLYAYFARWKIENPKSNDHGDWLKAQCSRLHHQSACLTHCYHFGKILMRIYTVL